MLPFQSPLQPPPPPTVEAEKQGLQLQLSPADLAVQSWIHNIRDLYETSERLALSFFFDFFFLGYMEMGCRTEIVRHREEQPRMEELPHLHCRTFVEHPLSGTVLRFIWLAAFRALVEENVKANVKRISDSALIRHVSSFLSLLLCSPGINQIDQQHYAHDQGAVFIHGWVYDVESGEVSDLGVSAGPPGKEIPPTPFPLVGSSTF